MVIQLNLFKDSVPVPAIASAGAAGCCSDEMHPDYSPVVSDDFCGERFSDMCHRAGFDSIMELIKPCLKCSYNGLCDSDECAAYCFELDINDPYEDREDLYDF